MSFAAALEAELVRLPWLGGPTGRGYARVIGAAQDAEVRKLKDVLLMRCPSDAPADAAQLLALDRLIPPAPLAIESATQLLARLDRAHEIWEQGGTAGGIVEVFKPYGVTASTLQVLRNHEVSGAWDGNLDWHSRFFVFLDSQDGPFVSDGEWAEDPGDPEDVWSDDPEGLTWDSSATVADLRYFRHAIRAFKSPDSYPVTIAVWLNTDLMPDGYWDSPGLWVDAPGDGSVWCEDEDCAPLYWTLGNVWGQEAWLAPGSVDVWLDDDSWTAFPGEE